jgi:hypothetical protein
LEQSYCLMNGALIDIYNLPKGNKGYGQFSPSLNFSLCAEIEGTRVGFLTVQNGLKLNAKYTGDVNIGIVSDYVGLGIEKVFVRKLTQWLFNQAKSTKKASLKVQVNELLELEFLINIRESI